MSGKQPGEIVKIELKFTITAVRIAIFIVVISSVIYAFLSEEKHKKVLEFIMTSIGVSTGIVSIVYVGDNLKQEIKDRQQEIKDRKELEDNRQQEFEDNRQQEFEDNRKAKAFEYIADWNNPSFTHTYRATKVLRPLIDNESDKRKHGQLIRDKIDSDKDLEIDIVSILEFLEQVATAVKSNFADEKIIYDFFQVIIRRYCELFTIWIEKRREFR